MATRKRLSDLLREEAKKSLDDAPAAASTQHSASKARKPASSQEKTEAVEKVEAIEDVEGGEVVEGAIAPAPAATRKSASRSTNIENNPSPDSDQTAKLTDLHDTINSLQASLKTAQQVEQALRQEVITLEASLKDRETAVQQLQAELDKAHQNNTELETTKRLVLQLSESNIQLTKEMETLRHEKAPLPSYQALPPREVTKTALALKQILQHPVLATIPSTDFSDDDIGWVD